MIGIRMSKLTSNPYRVYVHQGMMDRRGRVNISEIIPVILTIGGHHLLVLIPNSQNTKHM